MIQLSLNEIEQLCVKAARGAGFGWGLAEEAGMAAAWLARHGLDGPGFLSKRLALGALAQPMLPWSAQEQTTCPIAIGAALSDHAALVQTSMADGPIDIGTVAVPILLVPFIASMSRIKGHAIELRAFWGHIRVTEAGAFAPPMLSESDMPALSKRAHVLLAKATPHKGEAATALHLCPTSAPTIEVLERFAMRTTVPASVGSRAGAGADSSDSD